MHDQMHSQLQENLQNERFNMAISNEALPSLVMSNTTQQALLSLTEGHKVTVSMTYRPMMSVFRSTYMEQRKINVKEKDFEGFHPVFGNEFGEECQTSFPEYHNRSGEGPEVADPL